MNDVDCRPGPPLLALLLDAGAAVQARLDGALEAHGLSVARLEALRALDEAGEGLPLGRLAERLRCVKSNVTQLVDRLESDGLVRRAPNPADRRRVLAVLTEEGRRRCRAGLAARDAAHDALLAALDADDREALRRSLARLTEAG